MAKSSLGISENLGGLLAYLFGWISGLLLFLLEKKSKFVRFHALQSVLLFGGLWILSTVLLFIPLIGWLINLLLGPISFILWIYLMVTAFQGKKVKMPIVGDIAEQHA